MGLMEMLARRGNFVIITDARRLVASKMGDTAFAALNTSDMRVLAKSEQRHIVRYTAYVVEDDGRKLNYMNVKTKELLDAKAAERMVKGAEMMYGLELTV